MFCKYCGSSLEDDSLFCYKCGAKVNVVQTNVKTCDSEEDSTNLTETEEEVKKERKLHPALTFIGKILYKIFSFCQGVGFVGLMSFLIVCIIGLLLYGRVYLFSGYKITFVISALNMIFMKIGYLGIFLKVVTSYVFKVGKNKTKQKRNRVIALLCCCIVGSTVSFICGTIQVNRSDDTSTQIISVEDGTELEYTRKEIVSGHTVIYCNITNTTDKLSTPTRFRNVEVKAVIKNSSGKIIATEKVVAVDSTWLMPGESRVFFYMIESTNVSTVTLTIV